MTGIQKRFFYVALVTSVVVIVLGVLLLVSMGGNSPTVASSNRVGENPPPGIELPVAVDLNGKWIANDDGRVFTADITSETITITLSKGDTSMLYWYGSFDPTVPSGQIVVSDKLDIDKMVMSGADSKEFVIHDRTMVFDFTAMGVTKSLELRRG